MHKQDHTATDKGLDTIVEAMYAASALEPLSEDCGKNHPFVARKGPEKNKKFKKHHLDKDKDDEFKPKEEDYMDDPTLNPDWQTAHRSASLAKSMDAKGEPQIAKQVRDKGINASKTAKCDHCGGSGNHGDKECKKCGGDGWIDAKDVVKEAPGQYIDWDKGDNKDDNDIDHHNQYMMDKDLLNPLHAAAQKAGAKDLNDWMIQQIKDQGEEWVNWFMHEVIGQENI